MESYHKYNWVDAKKYAMIIFSEYSYMLAWSHDAWNLFMFGKPITENSILEAKLDKLEKMDIILWLFAMYDFYYDYQVVIGDVNPNGNDGYGTEKGSKEVHNLAVKNFNYFLSQIEESKSDSRIY